MKDKMSDLNNHLFAALERLNDEDLTEEQIKTEAVRAKGIVGIADQIIANARLQFDAVKLAAEYGADPTPHLALPENGKLLLEGRKP